MGTYIGTNGDDTITPNFVSAGVSRDPADSSPSAADDYLNGGAGADTMDGGDGDDIYIVDNADDVVEEVYDDYLGGNDTVYSGVSYTLGNGIENLILLGFIDINATGNELDNYLEGNDSNNVLEGLGGNDTLYGNDGNDILDGGEGADYMDGGDGNDDYYVDDVGDVAEEPGDVMSVSEDDDDDYDDGGVDDVFSTVSHSLGYGIENLYLLGDDDINGFGNWLDNIIVGNSGDNVIDGGEGADDMSGGEGDDTYYVDDHGDSVTEDGDAGHDTVYSYISYTLGFGVEDLILLDYADNGTGNGLDNYIEGNDYDNVLKGLAGKDEIHGNWGDDDIDGGSGNDKLYGDENNDSLTGGTGKDKSTGGGGNDLFVFKALNESGTTNGTRDQILDFNDRDAIVLSEIDANTGLVGNQAFKLDTNGSFSAGEIRVREVASGTFLDMNVDGDAAAEMSIKLQGFHGVISNSDFVF
jgi:Ca2+-binding RTX toxin-like protein